MRYLLLSDAGLHVAQRLLYTRPFRSLGGCGSAELCNLARQGLQARVFALVDVSDSQRDINRFWLETKLSRNQP